MAFEREFSAPETYELPEPYADADGLIAGYRVEGPAAQDGWGHRTYEATTPDGRRVALKLLSVRADQSRRFTRRVQRLLRLRTSIEHPHLLPILDWGDVGGHFYVAMPHCRAPTLADLLRAAPLRTEGALRLLGQLADVLETAHERGLVHRDLSPHRVLVEPRGGGHVLLDEFGVADPEWSSGMLAQPGSTPYLSPEKVRGEPLIPESNVYSLACMLAECLTGRPPYTSQHPGVIAYGHVAEPPPRPSEDRPGLPPEIDGVMATAMAKDPAERLASPRQLVTAAAAALGVQIRSEPAPAASPEPGRTQRPGGAPAGAAVAAQAPPAGVSVEGSPPRGRLRRGSVPLAAGLSSHARGGATALAVAAVVCGGALGFVLGRSGGEATEPARERAADLEQRSFLRSTDMALERLDARRVVLRRRLAAARSRAAQAAQARRLAAAYEGAGRMLPSGGARRTPVAPALSDVERAYLELAGAAREADRRDYVAAARAVRRGEQDLDQAITRLGPARG